MLAASPRSATTFRAERRFRAGLAHYANCIRPSGAHGYVFDRDATRDATRRMIDFFNQHR